jgi:hypothetical protein
MTAIEEIMRVAWVEDGRDKAGISVEWRRRPFPDTSVVALSTFAVPSRSGSARCRERCHRMDPHVYSRDGVPVSEARVGAAFVPALELVVKESQLRFGGDPTAFDYGVLGQVVVGGDHRPKPPYFQRHRAV